MSVVAVMTEQVAIGRQAQEASPSRCAPAPPTVRAWATALGALVAFVSTIFPSFASEPSTLRILADAAASRATPATESAEPSLTAPPSPRTLTPPRASADDEILLFSARRCGAKCDSSAMAERLVCERLVQEPDGGRTWQTLAWREAASALAAPTRTVVYVHGNRIERGEDRSQGMTVYRALRGKHDPSIRLRFVVWSWPSEQVPGLIKDYKVKAARTRPAAWQLAWTIDQMPSDTPLSLVGYSYGARVVTGALHLLGGGEINGLALEPRVHPQRLPARVALVAAAMKADWLRPGGVHGRAVTQTADLLLVNNRRDPIMRLFHLSSEGNGVNALGYTGPVGLGSATVLGERVRSIDVTDAVGRHHALVEYLGAGRVVAPLQQAALALPRPLPSLEQAGDSALAGRSAAASVQ